MVAYMDKNKLLEIFNEVLENWATAEDVVINDRSLSYEEDLEELDRKKQEYRKRFIETLNL